MFLIILTIPEIMPKNGTLANCYHQGPNTFMEYASFKEHYNIEISEIKYIDIRFTKFQIGAMVLLFNLDKVSLKKLVPTMNI